MNNGLSNKTRKNQKLLIILFSVMTRETSPQKEWVKNIQKLSL